MVSVSVSIGKILSLNGLDDPNKRFFFWGGGGVYHYRKVLIDSAHLPLAFLVETA